MSVTEPPDKPPDPGGAARHLTADQMPPPWPAGPAPDVTRRGESSLDLAGTFRGVA